MDFDLWGRFFLANAKFQYTDMDFAMFRLQPSQKIQDGLKVACSLIESAKKLVYQAEALSEAVKQTILTELDAFEAGVSGRTLENYRSPSQNRITASSGHTLAQLESCCITKRKYCSDQSANESNLGADQ
jgi:hypothetical protein